jgi:hypothetical protein
MTPSILIFLMIFFDKQMTPTITSLWPFRYFVAEHTTVSQSSSIRSVMQTCHQKQPKHYSVNVQNPLKEVEKRDSIYRGPMGFEVIFFHCSVLFG